jgi:hypothetical protein
MLLIDRLDLLILKVFLAELRGKDIVQMQIRVLEIIAEKVGVQMDFTELILMIEDYLVDQETMTISN